MTLHEFIILMSLLIRISGYNEIEMILPIGTLGYDIRYTSEYIPKLQIHQHCQHLQEHLAYFILEDHCHPIIDASIIISSPFMG